MPSYNFSSVPVRRGRITNARTGNFMDFTLNPTTISEKKGVSLAEDMIPGFSDPLIRFAAGKASIISFNLDLDGEVTVRNRGSTYGNVSGAKQGLDAFALEDFSIAGEIAFYEAFQFPTDVADGGDSAPDRAVFTFGSRYPGVLVVIEDVDINITMMTPNLEPTRANLKFTMKRIVNSSRFSHTIWSNGVRR